MRSAGSRDRIANSTQVSRSKANLGNGRITEHITQGQQKGVKRGGNVKP